MLRRPAFQDVLQQLTQLEAEMQRERQAGLSSSSSQPSLLQPTNSGGGVLAALQADAASGQRAASLAGQPPPLQPTSSGGGVLAALQADAASSKRRSFQGNKPSGGGLPGTPPAAGPASNYAMMLPQAEPSNPGKSAGPSNPGKPGGQHPKRES